MVSHLPNAYFGSCQSYIYDGVFLFFFAKMVNGFYLNYFRKITPLGSEIRQCIRSWKLNDKIPCQGFFLYFVFQYSMISEIHPDFIYLLRVGNENDKTICETYNEDPRSSSLITFWCLFC